jgi:hypothetical protein
MVMKRIVSALFALSVLAGVAGSAAADSVGPPTQWEPQDVSRSIH